MLLNSLLRLQNMANVWSSWNKHVLQIEEKFKYCIGKGGSQDIRMSWLSLSTG